MRRFPWAFAALNLAVICFHINLFGGWNQVASSRYAVEGPRAASSATVGDAILIGTLVSAALPFLAILLIFVSRLQAVAGPGGAVADTIASFPSTAA